MHFHLPKPLHGWREFAGEVGIIVIGIVIALAGEQAVEWLHWRSMVAETRQSLDREMADNLGAMQSRVDQGPCMARRMSELTTVFQRHSRGQALALKGPIGEPQFPHIQSSVWSTVVADGVTSHMPLGVRLRYSRFYEGISWFREKTDEESEAWSHLSQLDDHDVMTEQDWSALHQWKARAQSIGAKVHANVPEKTIHEMASALGIEPRPFQFNGSAAARDALCRPMI